MRGKRILLLIGGGIAAYKSAELIRLIKKAGGEVTCVLTAGGAQFITEMTLAALSEGKVYTSLWNLKDEVEMGHIQLSRQADLIVLAPATADLLAKMAAGIADDLATTILLATDKPVLAAPAMNVRMWQHEATRRNVEQLRRDGVRILQPDEGEMACGEYGPGRLPEPHSIYEAVAEMIGSKARLAGRRMIVTAGPTHEAIDPVRIISNRSSGKQGFAIAEALAALGAEVSLIAGPVSLPTPAGVRRINVVTAEEMGRAVEQSLPADAAIMAAAVTDWRAAPAAQKIKRSGGPASLSLIENPDLLAGLASSPRRPALLVGFAAETENVIVNARAKLERKSCDWIVANDVSGDVMGGDSNAVHLVTAEGVESWDQASKRDIADRLAERIADAFD